MNGSYDIIIIGGGANGAAAAAALTQLGYRLLLLEQQDFAAGATASASKLIHGGVRYFQSANARVIHASLQGRESLLRSRPHLVRPLPLLLPVYRDDPHPAAVVRASLVLHDLLMPRKVSPRHRAFSRRGLQRREPTVATHDLKAAYLFHDAQVVMPELLCLDHLRAARDAGADLRNYNAVDRLVVGNGAVTGVDFHDVHSGERHSAGARVVINAAGPWADAVLQSSGHTLRPRLQSQQGTHLILNLQGRGPRHAIMISARRDGRSLVIAPWLGHHVLGTTDLSADAGATQARAAEWEVDYLLTEFARVLPGIGIDRAHVLYSMTGIWPSLGTKGGGAAFMHHEAEGVAHLYTAVGGELGTAERLASRLTRAVQRDIGAPPRSGRPHALPARPPGRVSFLPPLVQEHLRDRYGPQAPDVAAYVAQDADLAEPLSPHHPDIGAQVVYAVEREGARTPADVLLRRTPIGLTYDLGRRAAPRVARIMQSRLGWSDGERDQAIRDYEMELHRRLQVFDQQLGAPRVTDGPDSTPSSRSREEA